MNAEFLLWLLAFLATAALLGVMMYQLIQLSDLENDFINPHDACSGVNAFVLPEYIGQGVLAAVLLLSGKWLVGFIHLGIAAYHTRTFLRNEHTVDITEIFPSLGKEKRRRVIMLVVYLLLFILTIYRLIETGIHALLTPAGREAAKSLFQEAVATM